MIVNLFTEVSSNEFSKNRKGLRGGLLVEIVTELKE